MRHSRVSEFVHTGNRRTDPDTRSIFSYLHFEGAYGTHAGDFSACVHFYACSLTVHVPQAKMISTDSAQSANLAQAVSMPTRAVFRPDVASRGRALLPEAGSPAASAFGGRSVSPRSTPDDAEGGLRRIRNGGFAAFPDESQVRASCCPSHGEAPQDSF